MPFCYAFYLATSLVAIYHQPAWCFFSSLITLSSSITLPCHWGDGKKWRQDGGAGIDDWSYNRHMGWLQPQKLMMDQCCQLQKNSRLKEKIYPEVHKRQMRLILRSHILGENTGIQQSHFSPSYFELNGFLLKSLLWSIRDCNFLCRSVAIYQAKCHLA